jgi:single-stranded-DNA-specific exonuclease
MFKLTDKKKYLWKIESESPEFSLESYLLSLRHKILGSYLPPENSELEDVNYLSLLPDPFLMKDMQKACALIEAACVKHKPIVIYADYDVDGTTSAAMLKLFFEEFGVKVFVYIPDRLTEGYGLSVIGVEKLHQQFKHEESGFLIITVDNGISALEGCQKASELGVEVIITDHHAVPEILPCAGAILNPKQIYCQFPEKMLAGVGVAFFLMVALRNNKKLGSLKNVSEAFHSVQKTPNLKKYLDFVALGTVVDMAPLTGLNHILCKVGLNVLEKNIHNGARPGLEHLLKLCGRFLESGPLDASDLGYKLGPRLNAAGRLGNAQATLDVLSAQEGSKNVHEKALFLHTENTQRQMLEKQMVQEAMSLVEEQIENKGKLPFSFVLFQPHWHVGVVGLVASRVLEKYYRPTLALGLLDGKIKGSGRSTQEFDLFSCLNKIREQFLSFGGHFHACGLSMQPEKINILQNHLETECANFFQNSSLLPTLKIQAPCFPSQLNLSFLKKYEFFGPFGMGNSRAKWLLKESKLIKVQPIGKNLEAGHARLHLESSNEEKFEITVFGMREDFQKIQGKNIDFVVEAKIGYWMGKSKVEYRLVDYFSN